MFARNAFKFFKAADSRLMCSNKSVTQALDTIKKMVADQKLDIAKAAEYKLAEKVINPLHKQNPVMVDSKLLEETAEQPRMVRMTYGK